ncbi:hypothetical protein SKC35_07095 [Aquirufa sp. KTFRIE-69F]|uniref:Uncharacterized protein n=1 Tax=Aquirufa originis TaxID=3096514 RepID=A0ABW6D8S5_9BACT
MKTQFNKYIYIALNILGIFYLKEKSIGQALIYLGIALAFDPFDTNQKFNDRPTWQKNGLNCKPRYCFWIDIY